MTLASNQRITGLELCFALAGCVFFVTGGAIIMQLSSLPGAMFTIGTIALLSACASGPRPAAKDSITVSAIAADGDANQQKGRDLSPDGQPMPSGSDASRKGTTGSALTLEHAVQKAVAWHPAIAEAIGRHQQQTEAVNEARAGYLPRLSWGVGSSYDSGRLDGYSPMLNANGSQMIYDFGKVNGRIKVATAGIANRRSQILMAVDYLARDAGQAVIEIQKNRALRAIAHDQIKDTTAILNLVRSRTERGASTRSDQLQAEARVQAAEATLLEIDAQLRRWEGVLATLIGATGGVDVAKGVPAWLSSACSSSEPDWQRVPAIMQAEAEQEVANAQLDLAKVEGLPTLSLDGGVGSDLTRIGSVEPEYRFGLNVTGSLYNGGETKARQNAAKYALDTSKASIARARVGIQRDLLEASSQVASMQKLMRSLQSRQAMMRETRDLYRAQYIELGTRTLLDLLNADQELHGARFDGANIEHNLDRLNLDCTFNTGRMREAFSLEGRQIQGIAL